MTIDILDSVTLQRLQTLEPPQDISTCHLALVFSPDSRILSSTGYLDGGTFVCSWDLQTGGVASITRWEVPTGPIEGFPSSIAYSANGKMVGVFYRNRLGNNIAILVSDVASGVHVDAHVIKGGIPFSDIIWTYGGSLRFATAGATTITIREVGFTSGATPTQVETLPTPDDYNRIVLLHLNYISRSTKEVRFLPAPCRLALVFEGKVTVWDVRNSKCLLCAGHRFHPMMSFSSDGHFFACSTTGSDVYLWKESPTGYILHGVQVSGVSRSHPLLSRNGESIAVFGDCTMRLWRTKGFTAPPSNVLTRPRQHTGDFFLDFSPDGTLAVIARQRDRIVTVLNLKTGVPQSTINASRGVYGLGVVGDTVIVIGFWTATAWNLSAGDAEAGPDDGSRMIDLGRTYDHFGNLVSGSISPDSRYIALATESAVSGALLYICNTSTGKILGFERTTVRMPRFSPDGRNIWCTDGGEAEVWRVGGGRKMLKRLEEMVYIGHPPEGSPWGSSRGYQVTDDWWILGPDRKRLLMLPPRWQSYVVQRIWKGRFLALLHGGLSEPVILELNP